MKQILTKAFTLIEIIAVAIIAGMLTMMALPSFTKMLRHSYGMDALHNLTAIYAAQQNYKQDSGGSFCTTTDTSSTSSSLGLNIIVSGGLVYSCSGNFCQAAVTGVAAGTFTMQVDLTRPVTTVTNPVYCNS